MTIRVGKSFADLLNAMQQLSAGLSSSQDDPKQVAYAKEIAALFESLRSLDEKQEKAKSELYTLSQEIAEKEKAARLILSKVISYLESEYGKTGTELQRYGVSKRQIAARNAVKKTPVKV
jgi:hypothetical protein